MTLESKILKGTSWLAFFKLISQITSWSITILIARILAPSDYALMEMATIITGYAAIISQLGLGSAIIQKEDISKIELSSIFWFALAFSTFLGLLSFLIAYPTVAIFNEPRIFKLTQTTSVIFVLTGLQIVPLNLLKKELEFKKIGYIEMISVIISAFGMLVIVHMGGGVWTLIGGTIIKEAIKLILLFTIGDWWPKLHFNYKQVKPYLKFGITIAAGNSLFYVYRKADRFFAGRAWSPTVLGYYSFALQLAQLPTEKIITIINQVSYSAFSKVQNDLDKLKELYLKTIQMSSIIIFPLYIGGYLMGEDLIKLLLTEKWYPIIPVFRYLCLIQIIVALNAFSNTIHMALGKPGRGLTFNIIATALLPVSFYFAVPYGLMAVIIPWFVVYGVICLIWIHYTISKININVYSFLKNFKAPFWATLVMSGAIIMENYIVYEYLNLSIGLLINFILKMGVGLIFYLLALLYLDKNILKHLKKLKF